MESSCEITFPRLGTQDHTRAGSPTVTARTLVATEKKLLWHSTNTHVACIPQRYGVRTRAYSSFEQDIRKARARYGALSLLFVGT
jgi:hypothetical protein